jgi:hypothetical protein
LLKIVFDKPWQATLPYLRVNENRFQLGRSDAAP